MKSSRSSLAFALAISMSLAGCNGGAAVAPAPAGGSSCILKPSVPHAGGAPAKSFDLRKAKPETIPSLLHGAKPEDLVLIDSSISGSQRSMTEIANSKAKFALVADVSPRAAQMFLEAPIGKSQILAVIPTEAEAVQGVFGVTSPEAVAYMKKTVGGYEQLGGASVISGRAGSFKETVIGAIKSGEPNDLFVMVGHNEGGYIKGPNGEKLSFGEINEASDRAGRPAIILSCDTIQHAGEMRGGFVTTRPLEFDEVAAALKSTQVKLAGLAEPNVSDFVMRLSESLEAPLRQGRKRILVMTVAGALVIALTAYEVKCDKDDPLCL